MTLDRIALISDVHGNLAALDAVLADIAHRGIDRVINLGDTAGKGPRGQAAVERCREACETNIRGNWDHILPSIADDDHEALVWWRDELSTESRAWLGALPLSLDLVMSGRRIRLFHASAESPHVRVHFHHTPEQFAGMFRNTEMTGDGSEPDIVGYADIHDAYLESFEGRTLFNTGSVGNPLDEPTPSYVILEGVTDAAAPAPFGIQFIRVPYDIEAEIAVAERLRMPERDVWATELLQRCTGEDRRRALDTQVSAQLIEGGPRLRHPLGWLRHSRHDGASTRAFLRARFLLQRAHLDTTL